MENDQMLAKMYVNLPIKKDYTCANLINQASKRFKRIENTPYNICLRCPISFLLEKSSPLSKTSKYYLIEFISTEKDQ